MSIVSPWGRTALRAANVTLPPGVSCLASTPFGPFTLTHRTGVSTSAVQWPDLPDALARLMDKVSGDLEGQLAASLAARGITR